MGFMVEIVPYNVYNNNGNGNSNKKILAGLYENNTEMIVRHKQTYTRKLVVVTHTLTHSRSQYPIFTHSEQNV